MNVNHYIGFDVHKKSVSFCVKTADGKIVEEGKLRAMHDMLRQWAGKRPEPWRGAMEAAARSLSATAKRPAISCRLVLCSLSHPNWSQSCKLILVADQEDLRAGHNAGKKVLALRQFTTKLLGPIDGGVHLSSKVPFRLGQGRDHIMHRNPLSDNHDVHVAACGFAAGCH